MKKASNISRVMEIANTFPDGFTTTDVREKIKGINLSSMHALMWNLKKKGILSHDKESGVYKLANPTTPIVLSGRPTDGVSTGVDKKKLGRPKKQRLMAAEDAGVPNRVYNAQTNQLIHTQTSLKHMTQRYEDALAIIRYLEDKLFRAIQLDARNGRNS